VLKIVDHEQRRREYAYLSAMQKADAGDYGPLGNSLPAPCTTTSTASSCRVSPRGSFPWRRWSTSLERRRAPAGRPTREARGHPRPDGIWRSSRQAVNEYQRTKKNRRLKAE